MFPVANAKQRSLMALITRPWKSYLGTLMCYTQMNAYFLIMNNKRFSWKNCHSPTLKFKLEREISWWQTHKLIILMITGRTARLRLEIYPETGWDVMTCYSHHTEILNTYAMKSWLFSCGVMFTGQTHLNKGHFPYNLDNTLSTVKFRFWNKHCHPEECSSKHAIE